MMYEQNTLHQFLHSGQSPLQQPSLSIQSITCIPLLQTDLVVQAFVYSSVYVNTLEVLPEQPGCSDLMF